MHISLIYNYISAEQDITRVFKIEDAALKTKKKFVEFLLAFPLTMDEPENEDDEKYDIEKLNELFFVDICLYKDEKEEFPKWYDALQGRVWFKEKRAVSRYLALNWAAFKRGQY